MGCLNSTGQFSHWFGNIHLSGPCNRSCYFCIGQHMMALDPLNNLRAWPLAGMDEFIETCLRRGVTEVNITGTNTEPFLFRHMIEVHDLLREKLPGLKFGVRTNGAMVVERPEIWRLFDAASVSITSLNPELYCATMGCGSPPSMRKILAIKPEMYVYVNMVLCPETVESGDVDRTLAGLADQGVSVVNLREPYGQPHIGNPLAHLTPFATRHGMPRYRVHGMDVTYWDVHFVHVESVNLYANGRVSETYPITKGHTPDGQVVAQDQWTKSGRHQEQWLRYA